MQIRMKTLSASAHGVREAGKIYTVDDPEALDLVQGGYAVALDGAGVTVERTVERAVPPLAAETETATGEAEPRTRRPRRA